MRKFFISIMLVLVSVAVNAQSANYIYDNLQRLTEIQYTNGTTVKYSYDPNGNRIQHIITGLAPLPDLQIQNASLAASSVGTSSNAIVSCVNYNAGAGTASLHRVIYFLSTNNTYSADDIPLDSVQVSSLAGTSGQPIANRPVLIPATVLAGNYFLLIYTDARMQVTETIETNNLVALPITVFSCNGLTLTSTTTQPLCGQSNGSITLTATGGNTPYQFSINGGSTFVSSNQFTGLTASSYNCVVKDASGCQKTTTVNLAAQNGANPLADFTYTTNGLILQTTNSSANATTYSWNFGDGAIANSNNPAHQYASAGTYNVCLTATNNCGTDVKCTSVTVSGSGGGNNTATGAVWAKFYKAATTDTVELMNIVQGQDTNRYYASYYVKVPGPSPADPTAPYHLRYGIICLNANGNVIWSKRIAGNNDVYNNYFGWELQYLEGNIYAIKGQGRVVKLDTLGNIVANNQVGESFVATTSGVYAISGGYDASLPYNGGYYFKITKTNPNLDIQWKKLVEIMPFYTFSGQPGLTFYPDDIKYSGGNIFVCGWAMSYGPGTLKSDVVVFKLDGNANILWGKRYGSSDSTVRETFPYMEISNSGNPIIYNQSGSFDSQFLELNSTDGSIVSNVVINGYSQYFIVANVSRNGATMMRGNNEYSNLDANLNVINTVKNDSLQTMGLVYANTSSRIFKITKSVNGIQYRGILRTNYEDSVASCMSTSPSTQALNPNSSFLLNVPAQVINTTFTSNSIAYTMEDFPITDTSFCQQVAPICTLAASMWPGNSTICLGQTMSFNDNTIGGTSRQWFVNNALSGSGANFSYTFNTPGTYTVMLVAAKGSCVDTVTSVINVGSAVQISVQKTNAHCTANDGTITIVATGGTPSYTYSIDNGNTFSNSNVFQNLAPNTYQIKVKDNTGCIFSANATISIENSTLDAVVDSTSILCNSGNTGRLKVIPVGGAQPYSIMWSTGNSGNEITNLIAGTYTVNITDANGCTLQRSYTLSQPSPISLQSTITPATCIPNGAISTTISGGVSPYNYSWSNAATGSAISGLATGNYTLAVTDANQCVKTFSFVVPEDRRVKSNGNVIDTVIVSYSGTTAQFCTGDSLRLQVPSYPAINYQWYLGATAILGATSNVYFARASGVYSCKITDINSCFKFSSQVTVAARPLPDTTLTLIGSTRLCGSQTLEIRAIPGYASYQWSNGVTTYNNVVSSTGNYSVTITSINGCRATSRVIPVVKNPLPMVSVLPAGNVSLCNGDSIQLRGTSGYPTYLWSNGTTTPNIWVKTAGAYRVTVTDANGCTNTSNTTTVVVNPKPPKPSIVRIGEDSLKCDKSGYIYQWQRWAITTVNNGQELYVPAITSPGNIVGATQAIRIPSEKALYVVSIKNSYGCTVYSDTIKHVPLASPIVHISPNPTSGLVSVFVEGVENFKDYTIAAYDISGKMLWSKKLRASNREIRQQLDFTRFAAGVYLVSVKDYSNKTMATAKVRKQ